MIVDTSDQTAVMSLGRRSIVDEKNPKVVMSLQEHSKFPLLEVLRVSPRYIYDEALFFIRYYDSHEFCSQRSGLESFGIQLRTNRKELLIKPISQGIHRFDGKPFWTYDAEFLIEDNKLVARAETGAWSESHSIKARFEIAGRSVVFKSQNVELEIVAKKDLLLILPPKRS
jgi:hypothetical protein